MVCANRLVSSVGETCTHILKESKVRQNRVETHSAVQRAGSVLRQVQMESALAKAHEQLGLLTETSLKKIEHNVASYFEQSEHGVSLLDAKVVTLLQYTASLCRFAAGRINGDSDDALGQIVDHLVCDWVSLERTRMLEKALRPRLLALLDRADRLNNRNEGAKRPPRARPDPTSLLPENEDERSDESGVVGEEENTKLYRPPKIAEVVFDGERELLAAQNAKKRERLAARVARNKNVRDMIAEVSGRPEEIKNDEHDDSLFADREMKRLRREEQERRRYEEENFVRLNVTREDKKRRRVLGHASERNGLVGDAMGDAFFDLVNVADRVIAGDRKIPASTGLSGGRDPTANAMKETTRGASRKRRKQNGRRSDRR